MKKSAEHEPEEIKRESAVPGADAAPVETAGETKTAEQASGAPEGAQSEQKAGTELTERIAELEKINAQLQDQYLRKAADFDNYRKRMIKEKQDAIDYANSNLLADLVKVLDDFDRAIGLGAGVEPGSQGAAFVEGISMIRSQMGTMLESKYGLEYYQSTGMVFDPHIHEAISSHPSPDVKEPTISEEFMKGYRLKDRIVRIAKVAVSMPAENAGQ